MNCPNPLDTKYHNYMTSRKRVKLIMGCYTVNNNHKRANKIGGKIPKELPTKQKLKLLKKLHSGMLWRGTFRQTPVSRYFYTHKNNLKL